MASTDPQSLLNNAQCYVCYANSPGQQKLLELSLLRQIVLALNPAAATDPQSLLTSASCFDCFGSGPGMAQLMELGLLAEIANGI